MTIGIFNNKILNDLIKIHISSQHGLARLLGRGSNNLNNNNNNEVNQGSETQQTSPTETANNNQQSPANNNPTPRDGQKILKIKAYNIPLSFQFKLIL